MSTKLATKILIILILRTVTRVAYALLIGPYVNTVKIIACEFRAAYTAVAPALTLPTLAAPTYGPQGAPQGPSAAPQGRHAAPTAAPSWFSRPAPSGK